jgi:hypothetical protein
MVTSKPTTTKQPIYNKIDEAFGGNLPGGAKPAGAEDPQLKADKEAQASCRAQGGQWDPSRRVCIMPNAIKNQTETKAPETKEENQVFRNESGRPAGITIGGKTYLGLSPSDVETMAAAEEAKKGGPATQAFEQGIALQQKQELQQQAAQQVSQLGLSPEEIQAAQSGLTEAPIDFGQALTAGTIRNVPSLAQNIAGGAAAGAALGAVPAVATAGLSIPVLAAAGGLAGAIKSIWGGVQSNIASQQKGEIAASQDVLTAARTNMRQLATLAANDPANAGEYVQAYNMQLAMVYRAQAQIKLETSGNLNKYIEDGTDILSDFDLFLMPNGYADIYRQKLQLSLMSGVPPTFTDEDVPQ